jgi:hypothetical protein
MQISRMRDWLGKETVADERHALPPSLPQQNHPRWGAARVAAVEALWGAGFTSPGGAPETLRLTHPLGLNDKATLLLLGGGLGGPAETIAASCGAWVDSMEADPELATIAEHRRTSHTAARKITVATWDRENPAFRHRSAHHALSLESLRGAKLAPVLEGVAAALRPRGQIVLTELVAETPAPGTDREFAAWCRLENRGPEMPRVNAITAELTRRRFDVRVVEDVSDRHVSATLAGWRAAVKTLAAGPRPEPATAGIFVTEAELWLLRVRLMRRFGFRLLRWHAIGMA